MSWLSHTAIRIDLIPRGCKDRFAGDPRRSLRGKKKSHRLHLIRFPQLNLQFQGSRRVRSGIGRAWTKGIDIDIEPIQLGSQDKGKAFYRKFRDAVGETVSRGKKGVILR